MKWKRWVSDSKVYSLSISQDYRAKVQVSSDAEPEFPRSSNGIWELFSIFLNCKGNIALLTKMSLYQLLHEMTSTQFAYTVIGGSG
jgi:hypothetical protein